MVALSGQRAPVDHAARRIAVSNDLSWRARTGGDVSDLSLTKRAACYCALAAAQVATTTALNTSKDCRLMRH